MTPKSADFSDKAHAKKQIQPLAVLKEQNHGSHSSRTHFPPRPDGRDRQGQGRLRRATSCCRRASALRANEANKKKFEGQRAQLEARNLERKAEASKVAETLDGKSFVAVRSAGETGQLYGSVSTRDIADLITAEGFTVNRNQILLNHPIKTIGLTNVAIALHPEVEVTVTLNIARSAGRGRAPVEGRDAHHGGSDLRRGHQRKRPPRRLLRSELGRSGRRRSLTADV